MTFRQWVLANLRYIIEKYAILNIKNEILVEKLCKKCAVIKRASEKCGIRYTQVCTGDRKNILLFYIFTRPDNIWYDTFRL